MNDGSELCCVMMMMIMRKNAFDGIKSRSLRCRHTEENFKKFYN